MHIPGGPLKTKSWNKTAPGILDSPSSPYTEDNYIIRSTYFKYQGNLSAIEYIPISTGKLFVDILTPRCPQKKNAVGEIVDTVWCPLTGACEEFCYSSLQFQPDWTSEWGPEWNCPGSNLDFCSLEGMCNYDKVCPFNHITIMTLTIIITMISYNKVCPFSPTFEFGGSSLLPHAPKTLAPLDNPDQLVSVQWDYKINMTFEVRDHQRYRNYFL